MPYSKLPDVAILYFGGCAGDLVDTMEAVKSIKEAAESNGHAVRVMEVNQDNWQSAVKLPGEVVFNLVEDPGYDLYAKVGKGLDDQGRIQVGHDRKAYDYVNDKVFFKQAMTKAGISTPRFWVLDDLTGINKISGDKYPLIVKPCGEHAGIGITQKSVVTNREELSQRTKYLFSRIPGKVIVEEYIPGREMHVTLLGNGDQVEVLPICEIVYGGKYKDNWKIYTYEAKWEKDTWEYEYARVDAPAKISRKLEKEIGNLSLAVFREFDCKDILRVDVRVDEKSRPCIVDVNISPSLNKYDLQDATIKSVEATGSGYNEFIEKLINISYKRRYGKYSKRDLSKDILLGA